MNDENKYDGVSGKFSALLDSAATEREIHAFLKKYPYLVRNAFNAWAWNSVHEISEFQFGSNFRADFLIISAHSAAWNTVLVELESPTAKPFNKNGTPSAALAKGLAQLDDWQVWIGKHEGLLREQLSQFLKENNVAAQCSRAIDHELAHTEIVDPRTVLHNEYVVVVGRRGQFDQGAQERRGVYHDNHRYIASYDRLLDAAKRIDWKNV